MTNKESIIKALRITEMQYAETVEQFGYNWIKQRFCDMDVVVDGLSRSKMFWAWWKNQWEIRDEQFVRETNIALINEELKGQTLLVSRNLYVELHNPQTLKVKLNVFIRKELVDVVDHTLKVEEGKL